MHPNPIFRSASETTNLDFVADRAFGTLAINADPAPLLAHIPCIVNRRNRAIDLHLVRSNPIVRLLVAPTPAVFSVTGSDSYISPDWYDTVDQVPTWNYVAVHLRGTLELLPQSALRGLLDHLSEEFETRLAPKPPWTADKMSADALARMLRVIVPLRLNITDVQGTWKLAQNKPDAVRLLAADAVGRHGIGQETLALAALMRAPPAP